MPEQHRATRKSAVMDRSGTRPVLRDPEQDRELRWRGVVTVPLLDSAALAALQTEVGSLQLTGASGFYDTANAGLGFDERQAVHQLLCRHLEPVLARLLRGYRPVMSAIINKWPGAGGEKALHRDLRVIDERRARAVCAWVPLVDVGPQNGTLRVLPGSHMVATGVRSVPRTPEVPADPVHELSFGDLEAVTIGAGEAVLFDLAVVHGSDVNESATARPAVGVALVPDDLPLSMSYCDAEGRVEILEVDDPAVFRRLTWSERPVGLVSRGVMWSRPRPMSVDELVRRSAAVADRMGGHRPEAPCSHGRVDGR